MPIKSSSNPMSIRSKNALAEALLALMMKEDFNNISISDITDKALLSRQTFYTNFSKKENILEYLMDGLFARYKEQLRLIAPDPDNFIVDYFIFWNGNRNFLSLLLGQNLGYIFQERNRKFFMEESDSLNGFFTVEDWQMPYLKAGIAGLTYELLCMWLLDDESLSLDMLSSIARNLLQGKIFPSE